MGLSAGVFTRDFAGRGLPLRESGLIMYTKSCMRRYAMSELKMAPEGKTPHAHPDGRRCCGRPLSEKCTPEEEASKTDAAGEKSCCKGHHKH